MKLNASILIAAALALSLGACGSSSGGNSPGPQASTKPSPSREAPLAQAATGVKAKPKIASGPERKALGSDELAGALSGNSVYADGSGQKFAALHEAGALTKGRIADADAALIDAALELGIAAAAVTVSRPGANPPWRREIA